ncbi:lipopolysaccharide biosynthesis protein RfbH [Acanthopleuribacter pedis]|uniref:Lipopolysaccharide biosynthesis protein RfbH n=2 Tax=Acanthopleuribacter pedis TaxID=442870 RepID=A0A8J7Q4J7_9BACT|nr:lipopolysaccharide biosynthesis protein RfbH [Acanthopleuribacter pedis]
MALVAKYHRARFGGEAAIKRVPVSGKVFDEKELQYGVGAVLDGWWTEGKISRRFEKSLSRFLGLKHCLVVNSGSSANLLALTALTSHVLGERRIQPGDEVITVAAGFPTTVNPILQVGCVPVFCDVLPATHNLDPSQLNAALSSKTKAVFLAHTLGNPFDLKAVRAFCDQHDLWLIEDNCDALGSRYNNRFTGTFGDLATVSFYPAHHITMGEGGVVLTQDDTLAKIVRALRDWGRDCYCPTGKDNTCGKRFGWKLGDLPEGYDHKYIYAELGYNLKNTDLNVALGLAQLDKLQGFIEKRKANFAALSALFEPWSDRFELPQATPNSDPAWFGFPLSLRADCGFSRNAVINHLEGDGIATRLVFAGNLTRQPYFARGEYSYRVATTLTQTDRVMNDAFWIGVYPGLDQRHFEIVAESLRRFFN